MEKLVLTTTSMSVLQAAATTRRPRELNAGRRVFVRRRGMTLSHAERKLRQDVSRLPQGARDHHQVMAMTGARVHV